MAIEASTDYEGTKLAVQIAGYTISWILVGLGWWITSHQSLSREKRKELRARIDTFKEMIEEIEQCALEFYRADAKKISINEKISMFSIQNSLGRLSRGLSRLKQVQKVDTVSEMVHFRQVISGGDFASPNRKALHEGSFKLHDISNAALNLMERLEAEYDRLCP